MLLYCQTKRIIHFKCFTVKYHYLPHYTTMDVSYIASGFHEDCMALLETFKKQESIRFETFCKVWKEFKFSHVFLGRKTYAELLEFCEESLQIAKEFSTIPNELVDQIGGLFLLYGLYYTVPVENVKIRVTLKEWQVLLDLHKTIKDEKFYDASYIFVKLVTDCAFHHCLFTKEYGLEKSFKIRQEHLFENQYSILTNIIDEIENGEMSKIQDLSKIYEEQKALLLNNSSSGNKLQLFDKNFVTDIVDEIEMLQKNRKTLLGLRKKSKDFTLSNNSKIGKKFNYDDKIRSKLGHGFDTDSSDDDEDIDIQFDYMKSNNHESLQSDFNEVDSEYSGHGKVEKCGTRKTDSNRKKNINKDCCDLMDNNEDSVKEMVDCVEDDVSLDEIDLV